MHYTETKHDMTEALSPNLSEAEDRLITLKELSALAGMNYRTVLQSRVEGRFLLTEIRPSPGLIRVRLSEAQAVVRGERAVMSAQAFDPKKKIEIHEGQKKRRAAAKRRKKGGAA
jgi:hypothetical protein